MLKRQKSYKYGLWAEKLVSLYLMLKGYRILAKRYKNYAGEIDLIISKKKSVIFVEVKARKSLNNLEVLPFSQQQRIIRAANIFLSYNRCYQNHDIRFDLIIMKGWMPLHIENAWM
jgi:putative endonuclease